MWRERYGNKYGNKSHVYEGIAYHSRMEAGYAAELDLRCKPGGDVLKWERQVKISLDVNGMHIANYFCDFGVFMRDKTYELHEVKGFETEVYRLKRKLLEATYLKENPNVKYVVVR